MPDEGRRMKYFCFTVDVDRDANIPVPGEIWAGSADRGTGTSPRFGSSARGLEILTDLLDEIGIKATYFAEGRTLREIGGRNFEGHEVGIHGYDHEDFTESFPSEVKRDAILKAIDTVEDITGKRPRCSRMPYMKTSSEVFSILSEEGIFYDSSVYAGLEERMVPYVSEGLTEVPVPVGKDRSGKKIYGYLWPMHENKRVPDDYVDMASCVREGIFVIATHSWHITELCNGERMSEKTVADNVGKIRKVLEGILDLGYQAKTVSEAVKFFENGPNLINIKNSSV